MLLKVKLIEDFFAIQPPRNGWTFLIKRTHFSLQNDLSDVFQFIDLIQRLQDERTSLILVTSFSKTSNADDVTRMKVISDGVTQGFPIVKDGSQLSKDSDDFTRRLPEQSGDVTQMPDGDMDDVANSNDVKWRSEINYFTTLTESKMTNNAVSEELTERFVLY